MYNACQGRGTSTLSAGDVWLTGGLGDSGLREYGIRTALKSKKTADAAQVSRRLETLRSHIRVYFPSEKTIEQSLGGKDVCTSASPGTALDDFVDRC